MPLRSTGSSPGHGSRLRELVALALEVDGVRGAKVVRARGGAAVVRLRLEPGADADEVAREVGSRTAPAAPAPIHHLLPPPRIERVPSPSPPSPSLPSPSVAISSVAAAPAPRWLGGAPGPEQPRQEEREHGAGVVLARTVDDRLQVRRFHVGTEGFTTVAEVVLSHGDVVHAGIADAAATPSGTHRALAGATARCLESAAGGRARIEIDGVQVDVAAGRPTAVVSLSVVTERGHDQLTGAALVGGDPHRAVVNAVLAAANRRIALAVADLEGAGA